MAYIKTPQEISLIKEGGILMGGILEKLSKMVKSGVSGEMIDSAAEKMILEVGGIPAFKGYKNHRSDPPFPGTICFSFNEEVVHGIPSKQKKIRSGDIVSIDIGMQYPANSGKGPNGNGYFTDTALTVFVGRPPQKVRKLMEVTQQALEVGIKAVKIGGTVADIGKAIEDYVRSQGRYGIVEDLVGHGVGHAVHEDPRVPNYYDKSLEKWKIQPGVVLALEPMITLGSHHVQVAEDGWSISTFDKSLSAHFEHTIIVTKKGVEVVTRRPAEL